MSASQLTPREYAYIRISGPGRQETITELLGIKPTEAWNVGDIDRYDRPRKFMSWERRSGLDDTHPLEQHIAELLLCFHATPEATRSLWLEYDLVIQCVGHYPLSRGPRAHFDRETVRRAAQYGFCFDCDFYYTEDHGHDG